MNCNIKSEDSDVICLDSSQESINDCNETKVNQLANDEVIICEKNINFDKTLPPGAAPDGFILLDESVDDTSDIQECTSNSDNVTETPLFKVIFRDKETSKKYKEKIQNFLTRLVFGVLKDDEENSELILNIWTGRNNDNEDNHDDDVEKMKNNTLFMVDTQPGWQDELNIPTYGKKFEKILKESNDEPGEDEKETASPKLNCFNCLGNHNLRDCTVPKNPMEITKNRREFNSRNGPKAVRYHVDEESKYDNFKPGFLSQELREALGLADNQLPRHIYKMRILGYPPGWLEEARLQHSGLNLYNSEGIRESEADEEQGEIFTPESRDQYDIKKIYDFPGFNIPAPSGTINAHWNIEQQEIHSKDAMLAMLSGRKVQEGYKRKKLKKNLVSKDSVSLENTEMEIELLEESPVESVEINGSFIPPIPEEPKTKENPPPPPDSDSQTSLDDSTCRIDSPSLFELEDKKKRLLEALDDSNTQSNPGTPCRSASTPIIETPINTYKIGRITSVELGTPLLQSTSPYTKLPSSEKFSKDICDVINYENLPNSTGKYEKMSGILQKVRGTLSNNFD